MGFGFNKKKKDQPAAQQSGTNIHATLDKDGNVELVSKNFKMKATQKPAQQSRQSGESWICWGCGQATTEDVCPICGKRRSM